MHAAEQFEIDFAKLEAERELFERWEANRAANAHNWTNEAMAMVWCFGTSDWERWRQLPNYERERIVNAYQFEQQLLEWDQEKPDFVSVDIPGGTWLKRRKKRHMIPTYREACPGVPREVLEANWKFANEMAQQLSADWSANRPPSIFTYDSCTAATVSMILGRKIEAVKPGDTGHEVGE